MDRSVNLQDKRNLILTVTTSGKDLIRTLSPLEEKINETIEGALTPRQVETCKALLLKLEKKL